jgi:hypothetical protein
VLATVLGTACAPVADPATGPAPGPATPAETRPPDPGEVRWSVTTRPAVDLWYHGLALIGFRGTAGSLPIHAPDYRETIDAAKRAAGTGQTPLDRRAEEFRSTFEANDRYSAMHFLPLHFASGEALTTAISAWLQVGGDPRRIQDPGLAGAVAFLSQQFPTEAERRVMAEWMEALTAEGRTFYTAYREREGARNAALIAAAQTEWDALAPRLRPVLDYLLLNRGELIVSQPLGPEGRTLELGNRFNRVAVLLPEAGRPGDVVWAAIHELMYPYVSGVMTDQLAPAQLRDADRPDLTRRAAIRAGAMVLELVAPDALQPYREAHLRWAGAAVPAGAVQREAALERAYPLPEPLPDALRRGIESMMREF